MNIDQLKLLIAEGEGLTVEFKEKYSPKIDRDIVAFANTKGGQILLGVGDNGTTVGEALTNKMKAEIVDLARKCEPAIEVKVAQVDRSVVVSVEEGHEKPYSCSSGSFRRLDAISQKMTQKEMHTILRESLDKTFEDLLRKDFSIEDVSLQKVEAFLLEAKTSYAANKDNIASFLTSVGVYRDGKMNNAGILMFASQVGRLIPYSETILGAFKGKNKDHIYDRKDVRDDLLTQLNVSMEFLKKHLNVRSEISGFDREDIYEIPLDALREAVVNAIIHRDYSMGGTSIYVSVFDDRVELVNPGGLPVGVTKDNFGKESIRRNLIIADLFHRMGKVERMGSGIDRMRNLLVKAKLQAPVFTADTFFHAIFYRNPEYALKAHAGKGAGKSAGLGERLGERLGVSEVKIIELVKEDRFVTIAQIADSLGISTTAVEKNIAKLREKGILKREGGDRGGSWAVLVD
jgi:ATP-dependent DNA helicase RecG